MDPAVLSAAQRKVLDQQVQRTRALSEETQAQVVEFSALMQEVVQLSAAAPGTREALERSLAKFAALDDEPSALTRHTARASVLSREIMLLVEVMMKDVRQQLVWPRSPQSQEVQVQEALASVQWIGEVLKELQVLVQVGEQVLALRTQITEMRTALMVASHLHGVEGGRRTRHDVELPVEVVERLLPLLPACTLLRARAVSREWRQAVDALRQRGPLRLHLESLRLVRLGIGHTGPVLECVWAPDGSKLVTVAMGDPTARVWSAADWSCLKVLGGQEGQRQVRVNHCNWGPDSSTLVANVTSNNERPTTDAHQWSVMVWSAKDWSCAASLTGHTAWVNTCKWSPDGSMMVTASFDGTARVWRVADWSCLHVLKGHVWGDGQLLDCAWSPDGATLVTASEDATARVWSTRDWSCLAHLTDHDACVVACEWAPDGSAFVTSSVDDTAIVWSATDWSCVHVLHGHEEPVRNCKWALDGAVLVTSSAEDGTVRGWSAEDGSCLATLPGHMIGRTGALSPDGRSLVITSEGRDNPELQVWSMQDWTCLRTFHTGHAHAAFCSWSPDGSTLVSIAGDSTLRVFSDI